LPIFAVTICLIVVLSLCIGAVFTVVLIGPLIVLVVATSIVSGLLAWRYLKDATSKHDTILGFVATVGVSIWLGIQVLSRSMERRRHETREEGSMAVAEQVAQGFQDPLTTPPNRALLLDRLELALARADRHGRPVAVLFLDLDNFKQINDTLGHAAGDHLLISIAAVLETSMRASDTAARWGGDEFVILLEDMRDP